MVKISASFSTSVDLLSSASYPTSKGNPIWAANAHPNVGTGYAGCIATKILEEFDIPIANVGSLPASSVCHLPGYDINNMDALSALKLSLAAYLKDGILIDVFANGDGQAEFVEIYPSPKQVSLNVRMCIPTKEFIDTPKVVVVRGYDPPPERLIRSRAVVVPANKTCGELTPKAVANTDCAVLSKYYTFGAAAGQTTCQGGIYENTAVVSYKDPVLTSFYQGQADQLYNPKAFEEVVGYIIDFDTHHTNENVTYQTSPTTPVTYTISFGGLTQQGKQCAVLANSSEYATFGYERHVVDPVEVTDRYGTIWPILLSVQSVEVMGHTIQRITDYRTMGQYAAVLGTPAFTGVFLYVDDRIVHSSVPAGKHWHWAYENGEIVVYLYSPKYGGAQEDYIWELLGATPKTILSYRSFQSSSDGSQELPTGGSSATSPAHSWPNLGSGMGSLVYNVAFTVLIDRPSIVVTDPTGSAIDYARMLEVHYYPIIMYNAPAPVAYTIAGTTGVVDHELDLFDEDPSTTQPDPVTQQGSNAWLEAQKTGHTLDVSLPFLETETECRAVSALLYKLHNNFGSTNETYSITCAADDVPELGATVAGFPNHLRVNEVNFSYQDSSSYTISVTLGPVYVSTGSWNTSIWQKKTETVSREGIIIWSKGDGCTYKVRIRGGLGDYYALNTADSGNYVPGEKVSVKIYNNPMES